MLKNILKLNGAQSLSKTEQKAINGGFSSNNSCNTVLDCIGLGFCEGQVFCAPVNGGTCFGVSGIC